MIKQARKNFSEIGFFPVIGNQTPISLRKFDLVYSSFVTLELKNKKELINYFKNSYKVLKEGGQMIVLTANTEIYNPERDWVALKACDSNILETGHKVKVTATDINTTFEDYFWTEEDLSQTAIDVGFQVTEIIYPIGEEIDNIDWKDEWEYSTNIVMKLTK